MTADKDNVFQKIIRREISANIVYESEEILAFRDIDPQAPIHIVIIPKRAIENLTEVVPGDGGLLGDLFLVASEIAKAQGLSDDGYRLVINNGARAGQTVPHLHLHLLGGRDFGWPPG